MGENCFKEKNEHRQSPTKIVLTNLVQFVVFLIVLGILNLFVDYFDSKTFYEILRLLNNNLWLILIFSIIFTIGEVFGSFSFPSNIPAPIFNAIGSIFLLNFLFKIFIKVGELTDVEAFYSISRVFPMLYPIVFLLVLFGGYITIFARAADETIKAKTKTSGRKSQERTWDDVGNEFREMLYETFHSARESIKQNKK
ncbi:MAG: hypothetical protein GYA51_03165 [Candidatus Methanofastidiosa archaeon]|jgi:hypothetical protein|nr:hypothetical protein [Candidatus Methanofastidiosa archaeon]